MSKEDKGDFLVIAFATGVALALLGLGFWLYPKYNVWRREMAGQAQFSEARWNRQITILEAQAKLEANKALAAAEVERAKGVAQANQIIGSSLKDNEAYLRYLWVQGLQDGHNDVIYVPTEANLPILEAQRTVTKKKEK